MKVPIYIIGAGGLGRGVLETVKTITNKTRNHQVVGFIDENEALFGKEINGYKVVGNLDCLIKLNRFCFVIIAIANPVIKQRIYSKLKDNEFLYFPNIVHPSVNLPDNLKLGIGNIISENVSFSVDVKIEDFVLIHFNTTIGHDVTIKNYSTIYPGANISGYAGLSEKSLIGSNVCILPNMKIGESSIVGAGSVVTKNIEDSSTYVGIPASKLSRQEA